MSEDNTPVGRSRTAYAVPTLFTVLNLLIGYYAIARSARGAFGLAALLVLFAAIFDKLDGLVARKTGTESAFGRELDSIADVVSFGVAPALISFAWGLDSVGPVGWGVSFLFLTCGSLRLARFNVQATVVDKRYFVGLPIPMAASVPMALILGHAIEHRGDAPDRPMGWLFGAELPPGPLAWGFLVVTLVVASLMVSSFRYFSFKDLSFGRQHWLWVVIGMAALLVAIVAWPSVMLPGIACGYAAHGPALWAWRTLARPSRPVAA